MGRDLIVTNPGWESFRALKMVSRERKSSNEAEKASEEELVKRAKRGDPQAFASLYDRYVDRVFRMVRLRVSDEMIAEDLTSEVFMKAWDNLGRYKTRGYSFGAWLFRIARNAIIDHYRLSKEHEELDQAEHTPSGAVESAVIQSDLSDRLKSRLKSLTSDQRSVLEMKFLMGLSTEEVGAVLGKDQGAIRALQMRGLQALAKTMGVERG